MFCDNRPHSYWLVRIAGSLEFYGVVSKQSTKRSCLHNSGSFYLYTDLWYVCIYTCYSKHSIKKIQLLNRFCYFFVIMTLATF
ncbi:hypothetical protein XELAEV_18039082mg [Xenopus laevis]|uniref:Uncharacterized protein n=1 Tax=Xenopus laevis TaxID=8355 RepID=A0A974C750_XENLA|nr:hypothetical protein XELAEV_18039082mg [Xenopus laevis]